MDRVISPATAGNFLTGIRWDNVQWRVKCGTCKYTGKWSRNTIEVWERKRQHMSRRQHAATVEVLHADGTIEYLTAGPKPVLVEQPTLFAEGADDATPCPF